MENVFDPQRMSLVAVITEEGPDRGQHVHVSLKELAFDMSTLDFADYFKRLENAETLLRQMQTQPIELPPPIPQQEPEPERIEPQLSASNEPAFASLLDDIADLRLAVSDLSRGWDAQQEIVSRHIVEELRKLPDPETIDARIRELEVRVFALEDMPAPEPFNPERIEARLAALEKKVLKPVIDLGPVLERLSAVEERLGSGEVSGDIDARLSAIERRFEEHDDPIPAFLGGGSPSVTADLERDVARLASVVDQQAELIRQLSTRPDFSAHVVRYDLALRARNGNVEAMTLMTQEAEALQTTMDDVINQIIGERGRIESMVMRGGKS